MASKKHRYSGAGDEESKVDMSPMIDMVFLLLIFFIVNATAIIVETDPLVMPPIAADSKKQEDGRGRIVVNVREDGTFTSEDLSELTDESSIATYVEEARDRIKALGLEPKLHLRGDQNVIFKHSRTAIRAAAGAGVDQVVFAVFQTHQGL
jgi:biopolymer transport protein ExbD